MTLKAILFDFNGIIINDEDIHRELINDLILEENLRPNPQDYEQLCVGRSDRACLQAILGRRGRQVTEETLDELIAKKAQAYLSKVQNLSALPLYTDVKSLVARLQDEDIRLGIVSGATRAEIELILERAELISYFSFIVAGDEVKASKPSLEPYVAAITHLQQIDPALTAQNCLAIEDSYAGISAAQAAGVQVVAVANTYPLHMIQRCADWAVDTLEQLEIDRLKFFFASDFSEATLAKTDFPPEEADPAQPV
ncbi:MAG: HAD family phosphatase [Cyanobacteria bacterium P01_H01_bin.15]